MLVGDRIKQTTLTEGLGAFVFSGTVTNFRPFSGSYSEGDSEIPYACANETAFEVGLGSMSSGTLVRDTVTCSSNSDAKVNWGAGQKTIICGLISAVLTRYGTVDPTEAGAFVGQQFINITAGSLWIYKASGWAVISGGSGGGTVSNALILALS